MTKKIKAGHFTSLTGSNENLSHDINESLSPSGKKDAYLLTLRKLLAKNDKLINKFIFHFFASSFLRANRWEKGGLTI